MKSELYYKSPDIVTIDIFLQGILCQSGIVIESDHDGFVGDQGDPSDVW